MSCERGFVWNRRFFDTADAHLIRPFGHHLLRTFSRDAPPMNMNMLGALAAVALLTACASTPETAATTGAGNTVTTAGPAPGSQEDLVKNVGDRVFYGFDQAVLQSEGRATLDHQAGWLKQFQQNNVQVAGNCDERGTEEFNIALGQRRANAARDYLVAAGVAGSRITTVSYGKDRPSALGSDEQSWAQNRNAITSVQ